MPPLDAEKLQPDSQRSLADLRAQGPRFDFFTRMRDVNLSAIEGAQLLQAPGGIQVP
jgi:hypothetical protein